MISVWVGGEANASVFRGGKRERGVRLACRRRAFPMCYPAGAAGVHGLAINNQAAGGESGGLISFTEITLPARQHHLRGLRPGHVDAAVVRLRAVRAGEIDQPTAGGEGDVEAPR